MCFLFPQCTSWCEVLFSPPWSDWHVLPFRKSRNWQLREEPQHMRVGRQEKSRAGMGQALPSAPPGNAVCHLIEHPSCCPLQPHCPPHGVSCSEINIWTEKKKMRKIEAEDKEDKERWEGGTMLAFQVQQKALTVASFYWWDLEIPTPSEVRYRLKLGTRHQSLQKAAFKLARLVGTWELWQQNDSYKNNHCAESNCRPSNSCSRSEELMKISHKLYIMLLKRDPGSFLFG